MRIEVTDDRVEGFCQLPGWGYESSVIALSKSLLNGNWTVASSMCLPSNINAAADVLACYLAAFNAVNAVDTAISK